MLTVVWFPAVSSQDLVAKFRAQAPEAPELPPAVLPDRPTLAALSSHLAPPSRAASAPAVGPHGAGYLPPPAARDGGSPPRPRFARSMLLRGKLTVHRADYSEPYTAWFVFFSVCIHCFFMVAYAGLRHKSSMVQ